MGVQCPASCVTFRYAVNAHALRAHPEPINPPSMRPISSHQCNGQQTTNVVSRRIRKVEKEPREARKM
jgi:hypothetical protein